MSELKAEKINAECIYRTLRPDYPSEIASFIQAHCNVDDDWQVADIGSGAGFSTKMLSQGLKRRVYAIEPDDRLRKFAEEHENSNPFFQSVKGTAEHTNLPGNCVSLVCAFQSFHWFDKEMTRKEFRRILRTPKQVLVAFSERTMDAGGFYAAHESILSGFPEYRMAMHHNPTLNEFREFLTNNEVVSSSFFATTNVDWECLENRFASAYYTPKRGTQEYARSIDALRQAFETHACNSMVEIRYEIPVYLGIMN